MDTTFLHKDVEYIKTSRHLSTCESFLHELLCHEEHFVLFANVDTFRSKQFLSKEFIQTALHLLSKRHQLLHSKISPDKNHDYLFEPMDLPNYESYDWIDIKELVVDNVYDWTTVLNKEMNVGFNTEGPLWRSVILHSGNAGDELAFTLIFICDHAILDGIGGFDLIANQLLPIMNNLLDNTSIEKLPKPISITKSMEDIFFNISSPPSLQAVPWYLKVASYLLLWTQRMFGSDVRKRFPPTRVFEEYRENNSYLFLPFYLEEEVTLKLIQYSKQNRITINTILIILLSSAIEHLRKNYSFCKPVNNISYVSDVRKFNASLSTSPMPCGTFIVLERQPVKLTDVSDQSSFLSVARSVNESVKLRTKPPGNEKRMEFYALVPLLLNQDMSRQERLINATDYDMTVTLSNRGNCDKMINKDRSSGKIKLEQHYFAARSFSAIALSVCTFQKQLCCCLTYNSHWLDESYMESLVTVMKESMITLTKF